jgi:glycerate dehydrogenase
MKIVVLDGHTLNPGDLDWSPIQELGNVEIFERSRQEEIIERASQAEVVLVNKVVLSAEILDNLPALKYIGVTATGYNNVDIEAAKKHGIVVTNVKAYSSASVAQQTFALLLSLVNRAEMHSQSVFNGEWTASPDFSYSKRRLQNLPAKQLG